MKAKVTPLHERIGKDIESLILSGELSPGDRIPFEHELMELYGCARMTVSKALSALNAAGLIDRRKRAGSFVSRPKMHAMILEIPDLEVEIEGRGEVYEYRQLTRTVRPAAEMNEEEVGLAGGGMLLDISGLHIANGIAFALEDRLISLNAVPDAIQSDIAGMAPGAWLLRHVPWTEAENRIAAINADHRTAKLLQMAQRDACLVVERRTWRGDERITFVRQMFVAGTYDLTARFGAHQKKPSA